MKAGVLGTFFLAECVLTILFIADVSLLFVHGWLIAGFTTLSILTACMPLVQFKKQTKRTLVLAIATVLLGLALLGAMGFFTGLPS
ncbi:hypothetical protein M3221_02095 [Domibacillus indicus]|uniref:hypothetical protein n=1 Tax=Domibacillus indicus TaxID=1437523 RepID=UPI00203EC3FB|nr:hypothetical protein [Domibacillus indicus]MCM3787206.1 hypothetical protein [Domibacillus indicus]